MFLELDFRDKVEVECEITFSAVGGESIQIRWRRNRSPPRSGGRSARLCEGSPHRLLTVVRSIPRRPHHLEPKEDLATFQSQCAKTDAFSRVWPLGSA